MAATTTVRSEDLPVYAAPSPGAGAAPFTPLERDLIGRALALIESRCGSSGRVAFGSPIAASDYFRLHLGALPHEVFGAAYLDAQNRLIEFRQLFRGTLTQTSVYPREVVKEALSLNAAAVILAHNHPSGVPEPSRADECLTMALKSALALVDVRVLDHIVVGAGATVSMAERGLL